MSQKIVKAQEEEKRKGKSGFNGHSEHTQHSSVKSAILYGHDLWHIKTV